MRPKNFQELIQAARERPDMLSALSSIGVDLQRIGRSRHGEQYKISTKKGVSDDFSSVVFCWNSDGSWVAIDNKERTGKKVLDSIGIMTDLFGMDFDSAVYALTGTSEVPANNYIYPTSAPKPPEEKHDPFLLPETHHGHSWKGKLYLTKERLIPEPVVKTLFEKEAVYMPVIRSKVTNKTLDMIGFIVRNEKLEPVGVEADATFTVPGKHRMKKIIENSDQRYGFSFKNNIDLIKGKPPIYFCESAVDAISLFALKNLPGIYVSMSGVKDMTLEHMTGVLKGVPVICTDNDDGGNRFRNKYRAYNTLTPEYGKDWNDELRYRVCHDLNYALKADSTLTPEDIQKFLELHPAYADDSILTQIAAASAVI